jgi:DNA-binding MurR/RpiR family transcriptional regulator
MKTPTNIEKLLYFVQDKYESNELSDSDLVQLIILNFDLLNLKTIQQFAKDNKKTYSGVSRFSKNIIDINGNKYVIDNN